jgi:protein-S-isoprenylcysteine O-methyltransferase Ste14
MAKRILMDRYLMANPRIRLAFEFSMIIITGILGEVFSWKRLPFSPYSNILGGIILVLAWCFHESCHRYHRQAHQRSEAIQEVVTKGVFSKIRHPMYLSLIAMEFGIAIAWGVVWMLIPVIVSSILTILTALREEEFLLEKFGNQYEEYMRKVPWRMIPKVF